jgi:hypothetical protein
MRWHLKEFTPALIDLDGEDLIGRWRQEDNPQRL